MTYTEPEVREVCPICGRAVEEQRGKHYRHLWCSTPGHFDAWRLLRGLKLSDTDAPVVRPRERKQK